MNLVKSNVSLILGLRCVVPWHIRPETEGRLGQNLNNKRTAGPETIQGTCHVSESTKSDKRVTLYSMIRVRKNL